MPFFCLKNKLLEKFHHLRKKSISFAPRLLIKLSNADVAKLADAPDLGSGAARHVGSTPIIRTHEVDKLIVLLFRTNSLTQFAYQL